MEPVKIGLFKPAVHLVSEADVFLIVGTSLLVYPAASLVEFVPDDAPIYIIDPNMPRSGGRFITIQEKAARGLNLFKEMVKEH